MKEISDVNVIGGGASGLMFAVYLKKLNKDLTVNIFESMPRVAKKLIVTGNGRCNITNRNITENSYHSDNKDFISYALMRFDNIYTENVFAELGVVFTFDEQGKAYPYSLQASSVVDVLRFAADKLGVNTYTECEITKIKKKNGVFEISDNKNTYFSKALVVASGLFSGGKKLGSTGNVLGLLKDMSYRTVKTTPALVQVKTDNTVTKSLKGIKVMAKASLYDGKKEIRSEEGEVLFCDYGLSGPPIMQISREIPRSDTKKKIILDLMPEYDFNKLCDLLSYRVSSLRGRNAEEFFTGLLNKRVGQQIIKSAGIALSESIDKFDLKTVKTLANLIKSFPFCVLGTTGFENSQVTAGGLDTEDFDSMTMMSKKDSGLFCIGEILDVDGDCGGFNLQWAWSSAMCAAEGVSVYLGEF